MVRKTHLAHSVEKTEYESEYDEHAKDLVSNKQVLARIVKDVTKEFKDYDVSLIEQCIEGNPEISIVNVYPGKKNKDKITGLNTESKIPNEGEITYDIRFCAITPDKKERVKIILNVEMQKKYRVGYSLVLRGIFYCARMLSEQLDTEFTVDNYDDIKKVYSIWVCMDSPEKIANTITEYSITRKNLYGEFNEEENYDLLSVVMIRLSGKGNDEKGNQLIKMLTTLLSNRLDADTKKKKLVEEHGMRMTEELEGGINDMCNLSEAILERGIEIGEKRGERRGERRGEKRGKERERFLVVKRLLEVMDSSNIVKVMGYDEEFVANIVTLIQSHPNVSEKEIFKMLCNEEN